MTDRKPTTAEVDAFNRHQVDTLKPHRCPNDDNVLEGSRDGWACASCEFREEWTPTLVKAWRKKAKL